MKPLPWRWAVPALIFAVAFGVLVGHSRLLVLKPRTTASATGVYIGQPDKTVQEYRRQRLAFFRSSKATADIVMLGDSLTEGAPWAELLPGQQVLNRGIQWDTTADVLARLDEVAARKPQVVVVMIGINDLRMGVAPETVGESIAAIASRLRAAGARVVLHSVLPVASSYRETTNDRVDVLNAKLQRVSRQQGYSFVDLRSKMTDTSGGLAGSVSWDGLHLSATGHMVWRDSLLPELADHIKSARH